MHAIDVWAQITTPKMAAAPWLKTLLRWTGRPETGVVPTVAETLSEMDAAGVDIAFLSAWYGPEGELISNNSVAENIQQHPERFRGLASVDIRDPMQAVRTIRKVVDGKRFVGVRVVPWLWELPPNDRKYYPIYAACIDAGVPLCTQIGHTGPLKPSEPGRLFPYLEQVMLDFPELVVVGGHVGYPWIDEVVSMTHKFQNFYVDTSAYVLKRLPINFIEFMQKAGKTRVMFGTNWPMLSPSRCLQNLDELNFDEGVKQLFLSENAKRIFNIS